MNATEALRRAIVRLRAAGVPDPVRDARILLAHATGVAPTRLTLHLQDPVSVDAKCAFQRMVNERLCRRPVSQIIGGRLFHGRWFAVTPDVLDPRPETETLVHLALEQPFARVLDLGTGSGAILLSLLADRPAARGLGTDISPAALQVAQSNAVALAPRAVLAVSDWFAGVEGIFDLIVSNPPYIPAADLADLAPEVRDHEPRLALTDDGDGLEAYRRIFSDAPRHLTPGGRLLIEIGPGQADDVLALCAASGLEDTAVHADMDRRKRVISAIKPL